MAAAVRLRDDFSAGQVRAFARRSKDADQVRRLLAIATILDGAMRFLPPYSPDFNPIEKAFSRLKPCSARSANEPSAASGA